MADWDCEAIIGLMSKIFSLLLCMFTLTLSSCGSWFYCNVSSYGTTPNDKSFYLIPTDSSLIGDLAFEEYANLTKKELNKSGYTESTPSDASLCIIFDYFIGEEKFLGTTTSTYNSSYTVTNGKITNNSSTTGRVKVNKDAAKATSNSSSNTQIKANSQTFSGSTTSETANYETPIGVDIIAIDNHTKKKVWKVEVRDNMRSDQNTTFRSLMPWLVASAQPYFGQSFEGQPRIDKKVGEAMGLKWPY